MVKKIQIDSIVNQNILNDRDIDANDTSLFALSASIKEQGLYNPIIVKKIEDDKYRVVCGQRRIMAFKILGLKEIDAIVKEYDTVLEEAIAIIDENSKRKNLSKHEEYFTYCRGLYFLSKNDIEILKVSKEDVYKYIKDIFSIYTRIEVHKKEVSKEEEAIFFKYINNCESLSISKHYAFNYRFLFTTDMKIIELLVKDKINLYIAKYLHNNKNDSLYPELITYIEESREKVTLSKIKHYLKTKSKHTKEKFSKNSLIEKIHAMNDEKDIKYLEKIYNQIIRMGKNA